MLNGFVRSENGQVSVLVSVVGIFLLALIGGAVDTISLNGQKSSLKSLADEASLSAAHQLVVADNSEEAIKSAISAYISARRPGENISVTSQVDFNNSTVVVDLSAPPKVFFPTILRSIDAVRTRSIAQGSGRTGNVCMIGLSDDAQNTVHIRDRARLTGTACTVYSNSTDRNSMNVNASANVAADLLCVAGGFTGPTRIHENAEVVTDCPKLQDPLANRAAPSVGACDHANLVVNENRQLYPGVYCGGLKVDGADARLAPGEYIIKDGPLRVTNGGGLFGSYTGFYLTGADAVLDFDFEASVDLTAPKTGTLAGLLFFAPGMQTYGATIGNSMRLATTHSIRSDDARRMVGTIYLPGGKILIDGESPIADRSEYTVVIAEAVELQNGPNLILRANYDSSDVPVPTGLGPISEVSTRLLSLDQATAETNVSPAQRGSSTR